MVTKHWALSKKSATPWIVVAVVLVVGSALLGPTLPIWLLLSVVNFLWPFNIACVVAVAVGILLLNKGLAPRSRVVFAGVAILGFVVFAGYYAYNGIQHNRAYDAIAKSRVVALKNADGQIAQMRTVLQSSGLIGELITSSKADVCYISDTESGWLTTGWYQECYVRYLEAYSTNASVEAVLARAGFLSNAFGRAQSDYSRSVFPCDLFEKGGEETLRYRLVAKPGEAGYGCGIPDKTKDLAGYNDRYSPGIKMLSSFSSKSQLNVQKNQIWIILQPKPYYYEDLGCRTVVFCLNPRSAPIQAE